MVARGCRHAGRLTGADPAAIWQWAFTEMVSTGLFILRLGQGQEAETFLAVAGMLAAATPVRCLGRARSTCRERGLPPCAVRCGGTRR
jgi:hypothetical protein